MNELQQVLLGVAVIIIAGLYFVGKRKVKSSQATEKTDSNASAPGQPSETQGRQQGKQALDELSEPHIPVSPKTEERLMQSHGSSVSSQTSASVPENQTQIAFDADDVAGIETTDAQTISEVSSSAKPSSVDNGPKHIVIEDPDMVTLDEVGGAVVEDYTPTFGRPEMEPSVSASRDPDTVEKTEPEAFVIIVMSTGNAFDMTAVNHALLGVGLTFEPEQKLYVKQDTMGNNIITVANLLDPGTFPESHYEQFATPGVVLILQLPTTVKAPRAMHDLIMMSRKISQRLNGRLYNMERQLMKESDLQAMRDAAIAYETKPA